MKALGLGDTRTFCGILFHHGAGSGQIMTGAEWAPNPITAVAQ